jgi:hypothetical protein
MAIVAAGNMSVVQRLSKTKAALQKTMSTKIDFLGCLLLPTRSWAAYRDALSSQGPPAVPYLGVFMTDITFINDGNKDYQEDLVNWKKVILIYRVLETVKKFQIAPFQLAVEQPAFTLLYQLPSLEDECAYQLSLQREPKASPSPSPM